MNYREMEKQDALLRLIKVGGILLVLIIGLLIFALKDRTKGDALWASEDLEDSIYLDGPDYEEMFHDNWITYLHKAYIVFGEEPNFELYKIKSEFGRDDYDFEHDFYTGEGENYRQRHENGVRASNSKTAIDVSEYQGEIDWESVAASGVETAIIRAGYRGYGSGEIGEDSMLFENLEGARAAGLSVGVYFFSQAISYEEGVEEAEYVLNLIRDQKLDEPVVIDSEFIYGEDEGTARGNLISAKERTDGIVGFCETVKNAGRTPMVYASKSWLFQENEFDRIGQYEIWLAAYYDDLVFPYHTEGWQYSPEGSVDGIDTVVDMNVWLR